MYSRKEIPAPFGTAPKEQRANAKHYGFVPQQKPDLHATEKLIPQGSGSSLSALLLLAIFSAKKG